MSTEQIKSLVDAARKAARHAHAPYSRFAVGAAIRLADGQVITGTNFENASYGLSLCAETVAIATANARGNLRDIVEIAVVGGLMAMPETATEPVRPCGRCRQILNEAADMGGRDIRIYCSGLSGGPVETHLISDLLPDAFGPSAVLSPEELGRPTPQD